MTNKITRKASPSYYEILWKSAVFSAEPKLKFALDLAFKHTLHHQDHYKIVQAAVGVPWQLIAGIHIRECSGRFDLGLHCGQRWDQKTTIVPQGRGPFTCWEDAAVDAFELKKFHLVTEWNVPKMLEMAEKYNGLGYLLYHPAVRSPYLWSGTNHYVKGKYDRDGHFNPDLVDQQIGIAALFLKLMQAKLL